MAVRRWWARWRSRRAPWVDYSARDERGGWMFGVRRRVGDRVLEYREVATLPPNAHRSAVAAFAEEVATLAYNMERARQRTLGRRPR